MDDPRDNDRTGPSPSHLFWEEQPVFRELFLVHAPPMAAASLREAGRHFYDAFLESGLPETGVPWVHSRVQALALDLRFIGRVLAALAAEPREASLDPEEMSLAMKGEAWGRELDELARALEAAAGPGSEPGPRLDPGFGSEPADGAEPGKEDP